jgi:hypothetical protein
VPKFDSGVAGGEPPVDLSLVGVGGASPGGEFIVEKVDVGDAPAEALLGQAGQFDLGDVEPGAVLGRVVDLQPVCQGVCPLGRECLVEGGDRVGVEVVHDEDDFVRGGVVDVQEMFDAVGQSIRVRVGSA